MVIGTAKVYTSVHEVMMDGLHRFSFSVCLTLRVPGWVFSMHNRLGVTDYVSTSCSCLLCMPNACTVRVVQECSLLPIQPNKTCILGSTFLVTGTSAGTVRISHCGYPKCFCGRVAYIHTLPQGEPAVNPTCVGHSHVSTGDNL